MAWIFKNKI